jgi:hypothetical protein
MTTAGVAEHNCQLVYRGKLISWLSKVFKLEDRYLWSAIFGAVRGCD